MEFYLKAFSSFLVLWTNFVFESFKHIFMKAFSANKTDWTKHSKNHPIKINKIKTKQSSLKAFEKLKKKTLSKKKALEYFLLFIDNKNKNRSSPLKPRIETEIKIEEDFLVVFHFC